MEFLAEASSIEFLTDLTNNYDSTTHSFSSPATSNGQGSGISTNNNSNNNNTKSTSISSSISNATSVKHVSSKKLPAAHPPRVMGGGSHHLTSSNTREEICDTFSGIMDGITGEPLHGTRYYVLTGEVYEGPFAYGGRRHGDGAIVRNVYRPPAPSIARLVSSAKEKERKGRSSSFGSSSDDEFSLPATTAIASSSRTPSTTAELRTEANAKFYGSYENDQPKHGTLVTSTHTYRGSFYNHLYHGENGTLVRSDGYTYEGEFQNGLYHGMGREVEAKGSNSSSSGMVIVMGGGGDEEEESGGVYTGEFEFGLRHGVGTYAVPMKKLSLGNDNKDEDEKFNDVALAAKAVEKLDLEDNDENDKEENKKEEDVTEEEKVLFTEKAGDGDNNDDDDEKNKSSEESNKNDEHSSSSSSTKQQQQEYYTYSGAWYRNSRQGEGAEESPGGQRYTGQFLADKRHGYGTLYDSTTGVVSEGMWRAGIHVNGNGWSVTYPSGDKYTGYAVDFIPAGYGICRYHNGDVYSGEWKDGLRHGEGICVYSTEEEYIGEWREDKPVGNDQGSKMISKKERLVDVTRALLRGGHDLDSDDNDKKGGEDDPFTEHETQRMLLSKAMAKSLSNSLRELNKETDDEEIIIEDAESSRDDENDDDDDDTLSTTSRASSVTASVSSSVASPTAAAARRRERRSARKKKRKSKKCKKKKHKQRSSIESSHSASDEGNEKEDDESSEEREHGPPSPKLQTYPNKDTYLGHSDPKTGHREGYGIYISSATGSTYTGNFRHNLRHGYGILIHAQYGKYAGEFVDDKKEGMGTLILNDASSYHGGFKNGVFEGKGTLCERDGTVYVGEWKGGFRHGDGMETLSDGRVYLGDYKDGERHGVGTMLDKSGGRVIYSGSWAHGTFHGDGVSVQRVIEPADAAAGGPPPDADTGNGNNRGKTIQYEGNFERGQRHGHGTLICEADGTSYKGKWHRDLPISGKWRIRYRDGSVFSGEARAPTEDYRFPMRRPSLLGLPPVSVHHSTTIPQPHGFGTIKYTNGDVYAGNFERGRRQGKGTCVFANGDKWEGDWSNDIVDTKGNGVLSMMDGAVHNFYSKTASLS